VTKFESFEHTDGEALNAFESSVGFALPADYREFLERHNGGKFKGALFDIPELHMSEALDVLFGFNTKRALDLRHWQNEMRGQIPNKSIIIGKDPGGNFLVLDEEGVYYYDHIHYYPQSSEEKNAYKVTGSFKEFLERLRAPL
jgi:hypothetical protein